MFQGSAIECESSALYNGTRQLIMLQTPTSMSSCEEFSIRQRSTTQEVASQPESSIADRA